METQNNSDGQTISSPFAATPPAMCVMCGAKENIRRCDGCKSVSYCSTSCQKEDWSLHKLLCAEMRPFLATRPSRDHFAAILLPDKSVKPELRWLNDDDLEGTAWSLLGSDSPPTDRVALVENRRRCYDLDSVLGLWHRSMFVFDGSDSNKCIYELTRGTRHYDMRGPILIISDAKVECCKEDNDDGETREEEDSCEKNGEGFQDVCMADFRVAVDFMFSRDGSNDPKLPRKVRGVVVACSNDQKEFGWKEFMAVNVYRGDPIFVGSGAPAFMTGRKKVRRYRPKVAHHLGIPLITQAWIPTSDCMAPGSGSYDNTPSSFLHLERPQNAEDYYDSLVDGNEEMTFGTILMVRSDGRNLTPRQLEALYAFCRECAPSEDACEGPNPSREYFSQDAYNPQAFGKFFHALKESKAAEDEAWSKEVCPVSVD